MPPQIALLLCILLIVFLFKTDSRRESKVSRALWIPLIWLMIAGSRPVAMWFNVGPVLETEVEIISGNPIDRTIFIVLIVIGILILAGRGMHCSRALKSNMWIILLFTYSGISILWSDFPFVSFKRWIKEIGNLIMILVVLTDDDPLKAISTVLRRCAYVLIPLSVVLVKYFPDFGRSYGPWTGEVEFIGVSTSKNMLAILCLVFSLFFFWSLFTMRDKMKEGFVNILFLIMTFWLLIKANSATSLISVILGIFLIIGTGFPIVKRNIKFIGDLIFITGAFFTIFLLSSDVGQLVISSLGDMTLTGRTVLWKGVFGLVVFGILLVIGTGFPFVKRNIKFIGVLIFIIGTFFTIFLLSFDVGQLVISSLGRDMTLTGRTEIWERVFSMVTNPLIGTGYESFWLGDRITKLWANYWWHPNQAHNGYIEVYLNLGLIGLFLLGGVILSSYKHIRRTLMFDFDYGRWQIAFLFIALVISLTEAVFKGISIVWFIFLLNAMYISRCSHA